MYVICADTGARSPILQAIHRLTEHPDQTTADTVQMDNSTMPLSSASNPIPSKSPILHAIHVLTNDPSLYSEEMQTNTAAHGCEPKGRMMATLQSTTACGLGFAGAFCLLAVTKVIADKSPELQECFQQKWAGLETSIAGLCQGGMNNTSQACQAVKSYINEHQDAIRTGGKRAFKVLLVGLSLLAVKSRPQSLLIPAKILLSPTCLVATAASAALLSHKRAVGDSNPYKLTRSQLTAVSGTVCERCVLSRRVVSCFCELGVQSVLCRQEVTYLDVMEVKCTVPWANVSTNLFSFRAYKSYSCLFVASNRFTAKRMT
jgi:hypothetical protein